jgi:anaerobic magnesium-protoporphyrin IX monomethyl ester cyclase
LNTRTRLNYLFVLPDLKGFWPTGLAYVSSYLRAHSFNVFCLNTTLYKADLHELLLENISRNNIDVVCTGGMTVYCDEINAVLTTTNIIDPKIIRVVGGPIVTSDPELSLKLLDFEIGVIGEGEETMVRLASALESNEGLENVAGLIIKREGGYTKTPQRSAFENLNSLPLPDYEAFDFRKWSREIRPDPYLSSFSLVNNPIVGEICTSRSCPFSCTFCYHPLGKKYRVRDMNHVFREIDVLVNDYKINFLNVQDELFSAKESRMIEFADRIKPYNIIWFPQFRVPDANVKVLRHLKDSGMHTVGLGVESISDRVLVSMRKKITRAQIESAYKAAREVKVAPIGNLIFGDVEETDETIDESLSWWREHAETPLNIGLIKAIPDAQIYRTALERGLIEDKEKFVRAKFPIINMSKVSPEKFEWLQWYVNAVFFNKLLPGAFGVVVKTAFNAESNTSEPCVDYQMKCPGCGKISEYMKFPYLGLGNVRVICRNLDCCREVVLEYKEVYRPVFSIFRVGLKKYVQTGVKNFLQTSPRFIKLLKKYDVGLVAIYRKYFRPLLNK